MNPYLQIQAQPLLWAVKDYRDAIADATDDTRLDWTSPLAGKGYALREALDEFALYLGRLSERPQTAIKKLTDHLDNGLFTGNTLDGRRDPRPVAAWLEVLDDVLDAFRVEEEWFTQADVARGFEWWTGPPEKRRPDSVKVNRLGLPDNGKTGKAKRISREAVLDYAKSEGLTFDFSLPREEGEL